MVINSLFNYPWITAVDFHLLIKLTPLFPKDSQIQIYSYILCICAYPPPRFQTEICTTDWRSCCHCFDGGKPIRQSRTLLSYSMLQVRSLQQGVGELMLMCYIMDKL